MVSATALSTIQQQIDEVKGHRASGVIPDLSGYDLQTHFMFGYSDESNQTSRPQFLPESMSLDGERYSYLARGAQAAVYCNDKNVIIKRAYTLEEATKLSCDYPDPAALAQENIDHFQRMTDLTKQHLESGRLDPALVAHAVIDGQLLIKQAWAPPVETEFSPEAIGKYPPKEVRKLIDRFAEFFISGFRSGLCETECSLFTNYSLAKNGALTIPDFGNVTYDYEEAKASVSGVVTEKEIEQFLLGNEVPLNERWPDWFRKGQVREALKHSPQLFRYYVQKMSEVVNEQTLEANWPKEYM